MAEINALTPQPTAEVPADIKKAFEERLGGGEETREDNDEKPVHDDNSEHKQEGVKRVEAITTVWSKELLIVMFVL